MENFAIFFIPSRLIVGSTRNQWPIIIDENTAETNKIGTKFLILLKPIISNEETIKAIEDYQKEKEPNDPVSVWVKFTVLKARMDISDSALKSRLADLKDMELVHYKEGYGYQAKSFDNEVF